MATIYFSIFYHRFLFAIALYTTKQNPSSKFPELLKKLQEFGAGIIASV
jgi:hypothetical protein